ncbi:unnamed protein product [Paramecium sonneborni]|uniref:Uncharacterized protein n=1 Tax=Paramecium sonneborni TaxID=65129 RepID=A0A8S1RTJ9_9CILI|nr:unnamed protein product [Paramecium sonneborni]
MNDLRGHQNRLIKCRIRKLEAFSLKDRQNELVNQVKKKDSKLVEKKKEFVEEQFKEIIKIRLYRFQGKQTRCQEYYILLNLQFKIREIFTLLFKLINIIQKSQKPLNKLYISIYPSLDKSLQSLQEYSKKGRINQGSLIIFQYLFFLNWLGQMKKTICLFLQSSQKLDSRMVDYVLDQIGS